MGFPAKSELMDLQENKCYNSVGKDWHASRVYVTYVNSLCFLCVDKLNVDYVT